MKPIIEKKNFPQNILINNCKNKPISEMSSRIATRIINNHMLKEHSLDLNLRNCNYSRT